MTPPSDQVAAELLAVRDWEQVFQLKELARHKTVHWTRFPVKTDSTKWRTLMRTAKGRTAYCVFVVIVQLVARNRSRGLLQDGNGNPIDEAMVELTSGIPLTEVRAAIELLKSPPIGWLIPAAQRSSNGQQTLGGRSSNGSQTDRSNSISTSNSGMGVQREGAGGEAGLGGPDGVPNSGPESGSSRRGKGRW